MVHEAIRKLCRDVRDLAYLYDEEVSRRNVYRKIADLLVAEAALAPTVALVTHGHPLFLVSASELIIDAAQHAQLEVKVLPAISSFDTLLCDLKIDYGYGLQIFDSTTLLRNQWRPNPNIPVLLFQIANTLNDNVQRLEPRCNDLTPLVDWLSPFYPTDHSCVVIHSSSYLLERSNLLHVPLRRLDEAANLELWKRPTLYIPPV